MNILPNIKTIDLCLYLKEEKALILGDIHMGYEEALNKQGYLVPRHQYKMTAQRLQDNIEGLDIETIIINGDVKHEFGTISETEWRHTLRVIDYLASRCNRLLLVKGNHDTILGPIADKRNIEVIENFMAGDILITHGDIIPEEAKLKDVKTIIIGHEHPAISLTDYPRSEIYKCFLKGKWKSKDLIVMPSFNLVTEGTDVLKERLLSPFLKNIHDFRVYIVSDEILDFGKVKDLKRL